MEIKHSIKDVALRLGSGQHKINCPFCATARKKKNQKTLSLKVDNEAIYYNCWHCGEDGGIKFNDNNFKVVRREPMNVNTHSNILSSEVPKHWEIVGDNNGSLQYLQSRGISKSTAEKTGVQFTKQYISTAQKELPCIVFPYKNKGLLEFAKVRSFPEKGFSSHGKAVNFYNIDNVKTNDWVIICEGEMDCLSFIECGYDSVISIPHGAVMKVVDGKIDPHDDGKFKFIWNSKSKLDLCDKVVIAMDNDASGLAMEEEIARRVGKDKCYKIVYPKDCKDANDVLCKYGKEKLKEIADMPIPYPVSGLYDASHFYDQVDDIYEKGIGSGVSTGYKEVDPLYTVVEGQLTVVTGHPSSGKSEFVDQIMVNIAKEKGWKFGICSFENEPRIHIAKLISKHMGKPFFDGYTPKLSKAELEQGKKFVSDNFCFLYQADGSLSTLQSILDRMKVAVMRHGIRGCVIDPYNYIAKDLTTSETDWISDMLTKLRVFAQAHGIHIWFVAHPTKMMRRDDGKVPPPKGYDIAGSASFFSKSDVGMTVHRPNPSKSNISQILIWKCRFSWVGSIGECDLEFDKVTSRYNSVSNIKYNTRDMLMPKIPINNWHEPKIDEYDEIKF
jgi:twinkle protein